MVKFPPALPIGWHSLGHFLAHDHVPVLWVIKIELEGEPGTRMLGSAYLADHLGHEDEPVTVQWRKTIGIAHTTMNDEPATSVIISFVGDGQHTSRETLLEYRGPAGHRGTHLNANIGMIVRID